MKIYKANPILFCVAAAALVLGSRAGAQTATAHYLQLSGATESVDTQGRTILVLNVTGDLPGVLTLAVSVGADGRVSGGEWALSVVANPVTGTSPDGAQNTAMAQLGTLKGSITGGFAAIGGDGTLTDLNGLQLSLSGATMQFAQVTSGTGSANGNNMNSQTASNGTLTLTF